MGLARDRRDRALLAFGAVVFGSTWLLQLPAILVQHGRLAGPIERYLPLVVLGYFAPFIAVLVLSARAAGGDGVGALLRPFAPSRISGITPGWALLALVHSAVILIVGMTLARLVAGPAAGRLLYPPATPAQVAAMLVIPFTEQVPWRGFVHPGLERRLGPLGASVAVGAGWAAFHLQKQSLLGAGMAIDVALFTLVLMTAGTVVFTWLHRRSASVLVVVIANAGVYLDNSTLALPGNSVPLAVHATGYAVVAVALVALDARVWRRSTAGAEARA